jgi:uncharacterized tellurite resistance protein B-like protein
MFTYGYVDDARECVGAFCRNFSMLDAIRSLFGNPSVPSASRPALPEGIDPVHVAACALLLEIAWADGEFSAAEKAHLESVLGRHFGLDAEGGQRLLAIAEQEHRRSVDHFSFTSVLGRNYDVGQKMVLAEVMWGMVLADGQISDHEQYLTRKISNLLELPPAYLSAAKEAAAGKRAHG